MKNYVRAITAAAVMAGSVLVSSVPANATSYSSNRVWSGLVSNGGHYQGVTATVIVPHVTTYCGTSSNVAVFVGIGGYGTLPFAQLGITVVPSGAGAWSEVFDRSGNGPVTPAHLLIRPGDKIKISLSFSSTHSLLIFRWDNLTLHTYKVQRVDNASRYYNGATADYITERSYYPYVGSPLARYGTVAFSNAKAVRYGKWVPASNPGSTRITLVGSRGNTLSRVTAAYGTSFNTGWSGCK